MQNLKQDIDSMKKSLQNKRSVHDYTFFDFQERIKFKEILCDKLRGQKLFDCCKRLGIFIVSFGEELKYVLHIECFYRIRIGERLILTYNDEFYAPNGEMLTRKEIKKSQKKFYKNSYLEHSFEEFKFLTKEAVVSSIEINEVGDLCISFDNGVLIEAFLDCMGQNNEFYRFFEYQSDSPHYVVKNLSGKTILQI